MNVLCLTYYFNNSTCVISPSRNLAHPRETFRSGIPWRVLCTGTSTETYLRSKRLKYSMWIFYYDHIYYSFTLHTNSFPFLCGWSTVKKKKKRQEQDEQKDMWDILRKEEYIKGWIVFRLELLRISTCWWNLYRLYTKWTIPESTMLKRFCVTKRGRIHTFKRVWTYLFPQINSEFSWWVCTDSFLLKSPILVSETSVWRTKI